MDKKTGLYRVVVILAGVLIAAPVFFLRAYFLVALCNFLGIILILMAERRASSYKQVWVSVAVFFAAVVVRFLLVFGVDFLSMLVGVAYILLTTLLLGPALFLDYFLVVKKQYKLGVVAFPVIFTANLAACVALHFGNVNNFVAFAQILPIFNLNLRWAGEFGLTFITMLVISMALKGSISENKKERVIVYAVSAGIIAALCVCGIVLKTQTREPDFSIRVAVATCEKRPTIEDPEKLPKEERLSMFRDALEQAGENNADMLILNEEYYILYSEDMEWSLEQIEKTVAEYGIPVWLSIWKYNEGDDLDVNYVCFYDENGQVLYTYTKHTLVPYIEQGEVKEGKTAPTSFRYSFRGKEVTISAVICMDINNSLFLKKVPEETELLIVPSWDWDMVNSEQRRTYARSIQLNTTILKHSLQGYSYASGPWGIYGEVLDFRDQYQKVEIMDVPIWKK